MNQGFTAQQNGQIGFVRKRRRAHLLCDTRGESGTDQQEVRCGLHTGRVEERLTTVLPTEAHVHELAQMVRVNLGNLCSGWSAHGAPGAGAGGRWR